MSARSELASPAVASGAGASSRHLVDAATGGAQEIVAAMVSAPSGYSSTSIYETGRLVSLAPWLVNDTGRIGDLLDRQRVDGGWGGPEGYALVPTLSATEALLAVLGRDATDSDVARDRLVDAAERGLRVLVDWLGGPIRLSLPDTPAIDLIVPALIDQIHARLAGPTAWRPAWWRAGRRLELPPGIDGGRLGQVRELFESGRPVPQKLLHALEVLGPVARRARGVRPVGPGTVGASPAATVAWIGSPETHDVAVTEGAPDGAVGAGPGDGSVVTAALAHLDSIARQQGGPVPCATPITVFERAWVLSTLVRAGVPVTVPPAMLAGMRASLGPVGTATGPGLPADADTTSVTMYALARLGSPVAPDSLWRYDTGGHFCTWQGEDGASVTTNAHVLEALGWQLGNRPSGSGRLAATVARLTGWLHEQQLPDGQWSDRWHASPYYATSCVVLALHEHGWGPARAAVDRAVDWVVRTQRPDGSWGRWAGTTEETAYALHVLSVRSAQRPAARDALVRGQRWLAEAGSDVDDPPLWHDKDLYRPPLIVRAAVVAAGQFARVTGYVPNQRVDPRSANRMIRIA